jgi:HK97 family phage prohead protease
MLIWRPVMPEKIERRTVPCEFREGDAAAPIITGHAAVFDTIADIGGFFKERVAKGAFARAVKEDDVRALFNHKEEYLLGRTTSGTLELSEDDKGLFTIIHAPDTQLVKDMVISPMKRGDLNQMSYAFQVTKEEWDETDPNYPIRTIKEVKLFDVSPVTFPAFPTTDCSVRSGLDVLNDYRATQGLRPGAQPDPIAEPMTPTSVLREQLRLAELSN